MATTAFGKLFARTGAPNLLRQFGETVTYYNRAGDAGRTITAIVERGTPRVIAETGDVNSRAMIVRVANDSTTGIASSELNTGGDEISLPLQEGESAVRRSVVRRLNDNAGLTRFLVQ